MAYSKEYLEQLELLHKKKKVFGISKKILKPVKELIEENTITSILDFGAGKGLTSQSLKEAYPEITIYTYDPATFPIELPEEVDLIYSNDVLEHIEPLLIDETLQDLANRATKFQFHLIACHPSKKALSDGRNAHLIIEKPEWWKQRIQALSSWKIVYEEIKEYIAHVKKGPPIDVVKYVVILKKE